MDAIENSLRRALGGGDPHDPAFRESIYAASSRAMERMIEDRGLDAARADEERRRLYDAMQRVEDEYGAAPHAQDASAPHEPTEAVSAPVVGRDPASYDPAQAEAAPEPAPAEEWRPGTGRNAGQGAPPRRRRRWLPALLALLIVGFVLWAALVFFGGRDSSPSTSAADGNATGVLDEPPAAETAAPQTAPASPPSSPPVGDLAWISVFSGGELEQISTPGGGEVQSIEENGRQALRLSAPAQGEGEVLVAIGSGLVSDIAGRSVRIEMVVGSPDGAERQFSVRCQFGEAELCERQRFVTSVPEEAFVFDVAIPADAGSPAFLALGPGIGASEAQNLDLYSVRLRIL